MTDAELQAAIAARPAIKMTKEYMDSRINSLRYINDGVLTLAIAEFDNGFKIVGKSAPAHVDNYDQKIGEDLAYRDVLAQAWPLFGFLLCEALHRNLHNEGGSLHKYSFDFDSLIQEINAHDIPSPNSSQSTSGA